MAAMTIVRVHGGFVDGKPWMHVQSPEQGWPDETEGFLHEKDGGGY
jgi:hypothetical protein